MDRAVAKFGRHEESEEARRDYYLSLTPEDRIRILLELIESHHEGDDAASKGFARVYRIVKLEQSRYVIAGGYALAFHGRPRFKSAGLCASDFTALGQVIQLGHPPNRIDILSSLTGVPFEEVWQQRIDQR